MHVVIIISKIKKKLMWLFLAIQNYKQSFNSYQFALSGTFLAPGDTCRGNCRFTDPGHTFIHKIKGHWMLFPAVLFSFSVGTMGKVCLVCREHSLGNCHTCHLEIASDRQGGELVGVKKRPACFYSVIMKAFWALWVVFANCSNEKHPLDPRGKG